MATGKFHRDQYITAPSLVALAESIETVLKAAGVEIQEACCVQVERRHEMYDVTTTFDSHRMVEVSPTEEITVTIRALIGGFDSTKSQDIDAVLRRRFRL